MRRQAIDTEQKLRAVETENARLRELRREDKERYEREKRVLMEQQVRSFHASTRPIVHTCTGNGSNARANE